MKWIGLLIVSPAWGLVSTQLFLQAWLSLLNCVIAFWGFIIGNVDRKLNVMTIGVSLASLILFGVLLRLGNWLLADKLGFGATNSENNVYWFFCIVTAIFCFIELPSKVRKQWRNCTVHGSLQADILKRKMRVFE